MMQLVKVVDEFRNVRGGALQAPKVHECFLVLLLSEEENAHEAIRCVKSLFFAPCPAGADISIIIMSEAKDFSFPSATIQTL